MKTCQIYITISVLSKYSFKSVLRIYFTIPKEIISFENSSKKKIISIFIFIFWSRLISNTSTFSYMFKNSIKCITFLFPNFNTRIYNFNHNYLLFTFNKIFSSFIIFVRYSNYILFMFTSNRNFFIVSR